MNKFIVFYVFILLINYSCTQNNETNGNKSDGVVDKNNCFCDSAYSENNSRYKLLECYYNDLLFSVRYRIDTIEVRKYILSEGIYRKTEYLVLYDSIRIDTNLSSYIVSKPIGDGLELSLVSNYTDSIDVKINDVDTIRSGFSKITLKSLKNVDSTILVTNYKTILIKGKEATLAPSTKIRLYELRKFGSLLEQYRIFDKYCKEKF